MWQQLHASDLSELEAAEPSDGLTLEQYAAIRTCIESWSRFHVSNRAPFQVKSLLKDTRAAHAVRPDDPVLQLLLVLSGDWKSRAEAYARLKDLLPILGAPGKDPIWAWRDTLFLADGLERSKAPAQETAPVNAAAALAAQGILLASPGAPVMDLRSRAALIYMGMYAQANWQKAVRAAMHATIAAGHVDPWLGSLTAGREEITQAWESRGGGWASSVTRDGWAGFKEHLAKARIALTAAWKLHPEAPEPADDMIWVCMGENCGFEQEYMWFDRALSANIDDEIAYTNLWTAWQARAGAEATR